MEYNQLDSLLKAKWNEQGDVPNDQGYSHFPGNINTLVFNIPKYLEHLQATGGVIPEFVNPKYANEERTVFKAPTRLECMMQDYPKLLSSVKGSVGFTTYPTWYCFSPAKNNVNDALACHTKGLPSYGAAQAEWDFYNWHTKMIEMVGLQVTRQTQPTNCSGINLNFGPKILFEPAFAITMKELRSRFSGESTAISAASTIVFGGTAHEKVIENL